MNVTEPGGLNQQIPNAIEIITTYLGPKAYIKTLNTN